MHSINIIIRNCFQQHNLQYPATQSLLPSPLTPQLYYITLIVHSLSAARLYRKYGPEISFFYIISVKWVTILLLPIYIFLYMNLLQAQMFQFHFRQAYIYKTTLILFFYIRIMRRSNIIRKPMTEKDLSSGFSELPTKVQMPRRNFITLFKNIFYLKNYFLKNIFYFLKIISIFKNIFYFLKMFSIFKKIKIFSVF